jgi:hypothetical protein
MAARQEVDVAAMRFLARASSAGRPGHEQHVTVSASTGSSEAWSPVGVRPTIDIDRPQRDTERPRSSRIACAALAVIGLVGATLYTPAPTTAGLDVSGAEQHAGVTAIWIAVRVGTEGAAEHAGARAAWIATRAGTEGAAEHEHRR